MKEWLIRLTLIAFGFIITIAALEFGLGVLSPSPTLAAKDTFYERDNYIGWKLIPNKKSGRTVVGKVVLDEKINSHGFRDGEYTYDKGKGIFRIVVLGDSFCDQLEMPLKQTFHSILEEELNSNADKPIEVINLGIGGFGTAQEYLTLKYYGLKYQPDLVILAFFIGNDVYNNSLILQSKYSDVNRRQPFFIIKDGGLEQFHFSSDNPEKKKSNSRDSAKSIVDTMKNFFSKYLPNTYYFVRERVKNTPWVTNLLWKRGIIKDKPTMVKRDMVDPYYALYFEQYPPEWENAWEVTKGLLLKLAKELEMKKIGFLVVIIPEEFEFRPDKWNEILDKDSRMRALKFDLKKPERILSEFLEANSIDYLLLRPEFKKYSQETGKDLHFHRPGDNHWNADGHALAAKLIYEKLEDDRLVPINRTHTAESDRHI